MSAIIELNSEEANQVSGGAATISGTITFTPSGSTTPTTWTINSAKDFRNFLRSNAGSMGWGCGWGRGGWGRGGWGWCW